MFSHFTVRNKKTFLWDVRCIAAALNKGNSCRPWTYEAASSKEYGPHFPNPKLKLTNHGERASS